VNTHALQLVRFAAPALLVIAIALSIALPVGSTIQDTVTLSLSVLYEATPFLILGTLLSVIVQKRLSAAKLLGVLPKSRWGRRAALSLSGSALPVCECGNVPLSRGLMIKGLRPQEVLTFLLAAPIVNPITLITTLQAFPDSRIALLRILGALIITNAVGWLLDTQKSSDIITPEFDAYCRAHNQDTHPHTTTSKLQDWAHSFVDELRMLMPALLFGSMLAGVIQTLIPRSFLLELGSEPVIAIVAMIALSFIVSICANVDAFFALSLSAIFPPSALLAFMLFGPMIDIKMIALLRTTFTRRVIIILSVVVFIMVTAISLGAHYVL